MSSESTTKGFVERRKTPRIMLELFGTVKIKGKSECYIQNIGQGGSMIFVNEEVPIGDPVTLSFEAGRKKFEKSCTVKNCRKLTDKRRNILKIGKSIDFTHSLSIKFDEELDINEFEYIKLNA